MPWDAVKKAWVEVVVGVLMNANGEVLINQRPLHTIQGGSWEFPGGKVERFEAPYDALARELMEEVGIEVVSASHWDFICLPGACVRLHIWKVTAFRGIAKGLEAQPICWAFPKSLKQFKFLKANIQIIKALEHFNVHDFKTTNQKIFSAQAASAFDGQS